MTIDVARTRLVLPDGASAAGGAERSGTVEVPFPLDSFARQCLLDGIDELEYLRRHEAAIAAWEARHD